MKKFDLLIDFDGCVTEGDSYPKVAPPRVDAIRVLNTWYRQGHTILFASCREGKYQEDAEATLALYGIPYHYFNQNKPERIEQYGHDSRKIGCDFLIDDREMGGMISWNSAYKWVLKQALDKPLVVCVVGESGCGKSLCANYLRKYGFKLIESYTTRPRRSAVEGGHTFVTEEEFGKFKKEDMIAYTKFGDYHYACLKKDIDSLNTYVIDEFGLKYFKEHFSDVYDIVSIRIMRAENARIESVGQERVSRDKGKFTMDIREFDYVIDNPDDSKESVYKQADAIMKSIL
jgi:guanylate kinase